MNNMQVFHKWLSSAVKTPNDYRSRLTRLTLLRRDQILRATAKLTWYIWEAAKTEPAA